MEWKFVFLVVFAVIADFSNGIPIIADGYDYSYEYIGGNYEGDMVLNNNQLEVVKEGRTALITDTYKWPNNIVPYEIDTTAFTSQQQDRIQSALQQIELVSCIRFVPRTTHFDYIRVTGYNSGCWAVLGRRGGKQDINIQPNGCMSIGIIIHEFLHSLGFVHMQSASDRDFYINILWNNITPGTEYNFDKYSSKVVTDFGIPFDYESVMHYGPTAFGKNGATTIVPLERSAVIGQRAGLSHKDIKRLNMMYPNCGIN